MGPAGAGKSTVGRALAAALGWPFLDADDFHVPEHVARMRAGIPLTDADRAPWLARVHDAIVEVLVNPGTNVVVACSALRQSSRERIAVGLDDVRWVYLSAPAALLEQRLAARRDHFAGPSILPSQLEDLQPPRDALVLSASLPVNELVAQIQAAIRS